MQAGTLQLFLDHIQRSLENKEFQKVTISHKRNDKSDLKNVFAKAAVLKAGIKLSFVYRYPTKDITKNFEFAEGLVMIKEMLEKAFFQADSTSWRVSSHEIPPCPTMIPARNVARLF